MNSKAKKYAALTFVYVMLAILYLPIVMLIVFSFTNSLLIGVWDGFTFQLYVKVFQDSKMLEAIGNTMLIALISSLIATFVGTISAVGIFYLKKYPKMVANGINQITVINADIVTGVAFMLFFLTINIKSGYASLIIAHTVITIPFVILSVMPRLGQLNPNLYEAGLDLGASPMRTLFTVILPQLIPSMISGFAMAFTLSLDDFVVTKFNNGTVSTISTYLYSQLAKRTILPHMRAFSAIIFIASITILVLINIYSKKRTKRNALLFKNSKS